MAKKSADGEMGAATPFLKLSKMNYRVWSMTMEAWWRTTPVATKTRYHGAGGALLRARIFPLIFTSLFLYYGPFDPHVFKRVLVYFFSPFRLPGGFFPFQDPICEAHPSL